MAQKVVETRTFDLQTYNLRQSPGNPNLIYFEGDGNSLKEHLHLKKGDSFTKQKGSDNWVLKRKDGEETTYINTKKGVKEPENTENLNNTTKVPEKENKKEKDTKKDELKTESPRQRLERFFGKQKTDELSDWEVVILNHLEDSALKTLSTKEVTEIKQIAADMEQRPDRIGKATEIIEMTPGLNADKFKKFLNWVTELKSSVFEKIPNEELVTPSEGFTFKTKIRETTYEKYINTNITYISPEGKIISKDIKRIYDKETGEFIMDSAFLGDIPSKMNVEPELALSDGFIPTILFVNLHQMKMAGIKSGGISSFKLSTVINKETFVQLISLKKKFPKMDYSMLIRYTESYRYAETIIIQSGHKIDKVRVEDGLKRNIGSVMNEPKDFELMKLYNELEYTDEGIFGFNIYIEVTK